MSLLGDNTKQVQEAGDNAEQTQIGQQVKSYLRNDEESWFVYRYLVSNGGWRYQGS